MDVCGVWIELLGVVCMLDFGLVIVLSLGVRGLGVCLIWGAGNGDYWLLMGEIHFHKKRR